VSRTGRGRPPGELPCICAGWGWAVRAGLGGLVAQVGVPG
jgi:hypothetical protein